MSLNIFYTCNNNIINSVVIKSLKGLNGDRRCWHQVGAVLAEKKVEDVLPLLCINRDQVCFSIFFFHFAGQDACMYLLFFQWNRRFCFDILTWRDCRRRVAVCSLWKRRRRSMMISRQRNLKLLSCRQSIKSSSREGNKEKKVYKVVS